MLQIPQENQTLKRPNKLGSVNGQVTIFTKKKCFKEKLSIRGKVFVKQTFIINQRHVLYCVITNVTSGKKYSQILTYSLKKGLFKIMKRGREIKLQ